MEEDESEERHSGLSTLNEEQQHGSSKSGKGSSGTTKINRRVGLETGSTPTTSETTGIKTRGGTRAPIPTVRTDSETVRRPSVLASHFPTSTPNQMPMMFYNPYMQYPMMPGQNFPMQNFLPHQVMMPTNDMTSMSTMEGGSSVRRQPPGQDRSKSSKQSSETRSGLEDESAEHMNLAVHAAQEQQRMMNQWAAASNFQGGSLMGGDDYLRGGEDYNPNVPPGTAMPTALGSFYSGGSAMPSPGFLGPNLNWQANASSQRGGGPQEQN